MSVIKSIIDLSVLVTKKVSREHEDANLNYIGWLYQDNSQFVFWLIHYFSLLISVFPKRHQRRSYDVKSITSNKSLDATVNP